MVTPQEIRDAITEEYKLQNGPDPIMMTIAASLIAKAIKDGTIQWDRQGRMALLNVIAMFITEIPSPISFYWDIFEMTSMIVDMLDAYGYNQAVTQDSITPVFKDYYKMVQNALEEAKTCTENGCPKSQLTPEDMSALKKTGNFNRIIRMMYSYAHTYTGPMDHDRKILRCSQLTKTSVDLCTIPWIRSRFLSLYTEKEPEFRSNLEEERKKVIQEIAETYTMSIDPGPDRSKIAYALVGMICIVALVTFRLSSRLAR